MNNKLPKGGGAQFSGKFSRGSPGGRGAENKSRRAVSKKETKWTRGAIKGATTDPYVC